MHGMDNFKTVSIVWLSPKWDIWAVDKLYSILSNDKSDDTTSWGILGDHDCLIHLQKKFLQN
jgi:hypothetical protein